jgi:hypothetical protein
MAKLLAAQPDIEQTRGDEARDADAGEKPARLDPDASEGDDRARRAENQRPSPMMMANSKRESDEGDHPEGDEQRGKGPRR